MNLIKKFVRNDNADLGDEYDDEYVMPEDLKMEMNDSDPDSDISTVNAPLRKEAVAAPQAPEKVALKLIQPKSHTEATEIADKLRDGCIILLDIGNLTKDKAHRLVDFLAGVTYVLGGEMIKTNKNTIVVAPAGVDISGFAPEAAPEAPAPAASGEYEEVYEEIPSGEEI
ncbi:MAG: cell division protein SepF [Ruminococcaceae bacterium]|nr:cell division protein SepF [Oscillospiraceae bacterium]